MALGGGSTTTTTTQTVWAKWGGSGKNNAGARSTKQRLVINSSDLKQKRESEQAIEKKEGEVRAQQLNGAITPADTFKFLTAEDVAKHDTREDCWIIINDKVYDVTEFGKTHPGGPVIFTQAGRDGTDFFRVFHSPIAWTYLKQSYIGDLQNAKPMPEVITEYRELRGLLMRAQLFKSSKFYYFYKSLMNVVILAASLWIISGAATFLTVVCSAFLVGLFWQQCGWLSHDYLHNQVNDDRWLNKMIGGLFWGNLMQGYSVGWWTTKHTTHHATTNECDEKFNPLDPDIDTVPLIAWSTDILATVDDQFFRSIIKIQHILLFPLLFLARFSWLHSSWSHARDYDMSKSMRVMEKTTLLLHYLLVWAVAFWFLPMPLAVTWILLSQVFCGFLLSIVFVVSHNGMDVYNDPRDFFSAQVSTTRNIEGGLFNDWFTGGLNRQIEHHLFPTLPRHNLGKVAPYVKALCQKHGVHYEEVSLWTGIRRVYMRVAEVAHAV